ncbi:MAG: aminotransferase class III-fold pyridoxal phosphate-dependent enzyme [Rhodospirillaceae bacterium]|nr:aminotransferase class III-fold pyridoxal phosphate-dependent enzyme [Rhodospirillaceae bacterium]
MTDALLANSDLMSAYAEAEERFWAANPNSFAAHEAAVAAMPGGNTRTVIHYAPFPLAFARGEGSRLWDADGHELVDFLGEYTAGIYGHNNPAIEAAIETALKDGIVLGGPNLMEARFATAVVDRFPALELVRFTNSGTEANLMAISSARTFTGREKVMVFDGGYHGGVFYFAGPSPLNAPFPFLKATYNDIEGTRTMIREAGEELACVILEPMMGSSGCIPASVEFLAMIHEETKKAGALMILDEVMTSRLSPGGLHGKYGITPDMLSLGKYVGGGMTFGAFGGRADIMSNFDPRREGAWPHAGTFNNNILTMSAGIAGLTQLYTPEAAANLNAMGDGYRGRLNAVAEKSGLPVQITGIGSMNTVHFRSGPIDRPYVDAVANKLRDLMHLDMIDGGIYHARRGMMNLSLPMTSSDIDAGVAAFENFIEGRAGVIERSLE